MENTGQNLGNHVRWDPPYHFFLMTLLLLHFLWSAYGLWQVPGLAAAEGVMLAIALVMVGLYARLNAIRVQDRVIRLEEHLRYQRVLTSELAKQAIAGLTVSQIIALRFASDAELADLTAKALSGAVGQPAEIKKAVRNWRGDYCRV